MLPAWLFELFKVVVVEAGRGRVSGGGPGRGGAEAQLSREVVGWPRLATVRARVGDVVTRPYAKRKQNNVR